MNDLTNIQTIADKTLEFFRIVSTGRALEVIVNILFTLTSSARNCFRYE